MFKKYNDLKSIESDIAKGTIENYIIEVTENKKPVAYFGIPLGNSIPTIPEIEHELKIMGYNTNKMKATKMHFDFEI